MMTSGLRTGPPPGPAASGAIGPITARLIVDRERCIGCGTCVETCPAVFAIGKDKVASVINAHLATTEQACAAEAAAECPQLAVAEVDE
jgi:ferredoxin